VGFFISSASWTNHQRWAYGAGKALYERGYPVQTITTPRGRLYARSRRHGMAAHRFKKRGLFITDLLRLYLRFKKSRLTTLFINYPGDLILGAIAARLAGIDNVVFRRGTVARVRKNPVNRFVFKYFITTVVTNSEANKKVMIRNKGSLFQPERTHVIYNGMDFSGNTEMNTALHNYRNNGELMVGVITGDLQPGRFFRLMELLRREQHHAANFRFLLHGNGNNQREIKQRLRHHPSLRQMLVWDSRSRNLAEFMDSIDVFITGNISNGLNHPLMHALAHCKPVIGYEAGSNPEIIKHNENGYLLKTGDIQGIHEKLNVLLDPDHRVSLGREGRRSMEKYFNMGRTVDQIESLLR
jgi:glycosyltransferase involved in cell wall biosynthesis